METPIESRAFQAGACCPGVAGASFCVPGPLSSPSPTDGCETARPISLIESSNDRLDVSPGSGVPTPDPDTDTGVPDVVGGCNAEENAWNGVKAVPPMESGRCGKGGEAR